MSKYYQIGFHPCNTSIIEVLHSLGHTKALSQEDADFFVVSCLSKNYSTTDKPAILLSSSSVYSCLYSNSRVKETPFTEEQPLVIPSTYGCSRQAEWVFGESINCNSYPNNITLRICNPFGYLENDSIIDTSKLLFQVGKEVVIHHSLYRKKSFIYKDDLEILLEKVIKLFTEGLRGIYNIGGDEIITVENVVETVHNTLYPKNNIKLNLEVTDVKRFCNFYESVDTTRIKAIANWEPKISTRKGIWLYVNSV
jgi:nucleoside-diphosphate-sugar epimerase